MKTKLHLSLILLFLFNLIQGQTTSDCKVIHEELIGNYKGDCVKGLANGKGEFTFANGDFVYKGNFKDGKMNGQGVIYSMQNKLKKIVSKGFWENNIYVGDKSRPYEVIRNLNLDRYTVIKAAGEENKVFINFYQNGSRNNVSNLNVFENNGTKISGNYTEGYENIIYPFVCQINYTTANKFKATSYDVNFEIVINEPGSWEIFLYN